MEQQERAKHALLYYEVAEQLDVSWPEYILLDMIYYLQARTGYCYKSVSDIAKDIRLTKRGVNKMIARLLERGLILRLTGYTLRVTDKYITVQTMRGNSVPSSGNKVPETGVIKFQQSGNKVPPVGTEFLKVGTEFQNNRGLELHRTTIKNNYNNLDKSKLAKAEYGKPEINELFEFWQQTVGYQLESKVKLNRMACNNLIKRYGTDKLKQLVKGVAATQSDQYAPRIQDFIALQAKLNDLLMWGRKKGMGYGRQSVDLTK